MKIRFRFYRSLHKEIDTLKGENILLSNEIIQLRNKNKVLLDKITAILNGNILLQENNELKDKINKLGEENKLLEQKVTFINTFGFSKEKLESLLKLSQIIKVDLKRDDASFKDKGASSPCK